MARKRFKAEQIVVMLREAEVHMSKGLDIYQVCRNNGTLTIYLLSFYFPLFSSIVALVGHRLGIK